MRGLSAAPPGRAGGGLALKLPQPFDLLPVLLSGVVTTLEVTLASAVVALLLSFAIGLMRLSPLRLVRFIAGFYVEVIRGTSALVQLFYLFFILPVVGIRIDPFSTAVLGIGVNISAYGAEIVRAAIRDIDRGQWEAATALDMPRLLGAAPDHPAPGAAGDAALLRQSDGRSPEADLAGLADHPHRPHLRRHGADHHHGPAGAGLGAGPRPLFPHGHAHRLGWPGGWRPRWRHASAGGAEP